MACKPIPTEVVIIDDKGLIFCDDEGNPVAGGARVIFRRDVVYEGDGDRTIWVSVNTKYTEAQFDSLADLRAWASEEGLKLEVSETDDGE
jgi:hypothetical protein